MNKEYERALEAQTSGNWNHALQLLYLGANTRDAKCMWWLSLLYRYGLWVNEDKNRAKEWTKRGLSLGYPKCIFDYTIYYTKNENDREWWQNNTFQSACADQYTMAMCYNGTITMRNDDMFFEYMLPLKDDPFAAFEIGVYYEEYLGNTKDAKLSYLQSAKKGFGLAQNRLAILLDEEDNSPEAVFWYRKAAEQNYNSAKYNLALLFLEMENYAAALFWVKSGITTPDNITEFNKLYQNHEIRFERVVLCQNGCLVLVAIRKFRSSILSLLPRDVVCLIAKIMWKSRNDDVWDK